MKPRRSHKKSRNGCDTCRHRRIKCDERTPVCINCEIRQLTCAYTKVQRNVLLQPMDASKTEQLSPSTPSSSSHLHRGHSEHERTNSTRVLELQLMHHYITQTCPTLEIKPGLSSIFMTDVAYEALKHEFLMNQILALAAFHLSWVNSTLSSYFRLHALEYQGISFNQFNTIMEDLDPDNADASFLFLILTMITTLLPIPGINETDYRIAIEKMISLTQCLQKMGPIINQIKDHVLSGPLAGFIIPKAMDNEIIDHDFNAALERLRSIAIPEAWSENEELDKTHNHAIDCLKECVLNGQQATIVWLSMIKKEYISLVKSNDLTALVILAHWGFLLHGMRHFWWVGSYGKTLIDGISSSINWYDSPYSECIVWLRDRVVIREST